MNSSRVLSLVTLLIFTASIGGCNEGVPTQGKGIEPVASTVRLAVFSDAAIILGEDRVGLRDLKGALDQMTRKSATYLVYDFSPIVPMTVVQDVLKTVAESQVAGVSYASGDGGADHSRSFYRPVIDHASVAGRM